MISRRVSSRQLRSLLGEKPLPCATIQRNQQRYRKQDKYNPLLWKEKEHERLWHIGAVSPTRLECTKPYGPRSRFSTNSPFPKSAFGTTLAKKNKTQDGSVKLANGSSTAHSSTNGSVPRTRACFMSPPNPVGASSSFRDMCSRKSSRLTRSARSFYISSSKRAKGSRTEHRRPWLQ
jgi:hypothetical protein